MGSAYDRAGEFLGSAEADSAREVLEKLQLQHKEAAEFRIKTAEGVAAEVHAKAEQAASNPGRAVDRMEQFFAYAHLPANLQAVSEPFCRLATLVCDTLPSNPERTVALRKLLEAKDCAVRALLFK